MNRIGIFWFVASFWMASMIMTVMTPPWVVQGRLSSRRVDKPVWGLSSEEQREESRVDHWVLLCRLGSITFGWGAIGSLLMAIWSFSGPASEKAASSIKRLFEIFVWTVVISTLMAAAGFIIFRYASEPKPSLILEESRPTPRSGLR